MNNAIMVSFCVLGWSIYQYIFNQNLKKYGPNDMTWLTVVYLCCIVFPVFYTLNEAVNTVALVDAGCKKKLGLLDFNVELLSKATQDPAKRAQMLKFREELASIIALVEKYQIPKYKFLWGIEISPTVKNTIVGSISTSLLALTLSVVNNIKSAAVDAVTE